MRRQNFGKNTPQKCVPLRINLKYEYLRVRQDGSAITELTCHFSVDKILLRELIRWTIPFVSSESEIRAWLRAESGCSTLCLDFICETKLSFSEWRMRASMVYDMMSKKYYWKLLVLCWQKFGYDISRQMRDGKL